ncbi:hypothetical protein ARMGADRAFT_1032361 [Armillaria gallica]|uniref:Uncharacterized protein n=1 Tax=Armillaria gallica TaxID=47427 RepID=A0A2H3D6J8_ARMGA|nr:hypothetical protein ARMGADRAFT_1032361 [Armillaria gallica]
MGYFGVCNVVVPHRVPSQSDVMQELIGWGDDCYKYYQQWLGWLFQCLRLSSHLCDALHKCTRVLTQAASIDSIASPVLAFTGVNGKINILRKIVCKRGCMDDNNFMPKFATSANYVYTGQDVDPRGVLVRLAGSNLIHTEENDVNYYRGLIEGSKKRQVDLIHVNRLEANSFDDGRYARAKMQMFRVGDIVEAQCSVVFVRYKGNGAKMKLILRGMAMVNCDHAMNADRERRRGTRFEMRAVSGGRMKMKVGFEYEVDSFEEQASMKKHAGEARKSEEVEREMEEREEMIE